MEGAPSEALIFVPLNHLIVCISLVDGMAMNIDPARELTNLESCALDEKSALGERLFNEKRLGSKFQRETKKKMQHNGKPRFRS
jgi:hypothetical protein